MISFILHDGGDKAADKVDGDPHFVFETESLEMGNSLHVSVEKIEQEHYGHNTKKPFPARIEVVFKSFILSEVPRKKESAQQIDRNPVKDDERVKGERPSSYGRQLKFPPPKGNGVKDHVKNPHQVDPVDPLPFTLGELRDPSQEASEAEANQSC